VEPEWKGGKKEKKRSHGDKKGRLLQLPPIVREGLSGPKNTTDIQEGPLGQGEAKKTEHNREPEKGSWLEWDSTIRPIKGS